MKAPVHPVYSLPIPFDSMHYDDASVDLHEKHHGKLRIETTVPLETKENLSLAYTPGVAAPCRAIVNDPEAI